MIPELELIWKSPLWGLASVVPEGAIQASSERGNQQAYLTMLPINHINDQHGKIVLNVK